MGSGRLRPSSEVQLRNIGSALARRGLLRPTRRGARLWGLAVIPASLLVSSVLVVNSSYSVFTATTSNTSNSWATGSVILSDDDSSTAMFTATGLTAGSTGSKCIAVTSTGSMPSSVKLYGTSYSTTNSLGSNLTITVTQGTGGTFSNCSGFTALVSNSAVYSGTLDSFGTTKTSYATGVPGTGFWQPTGSGSETRVFKFDYSVGAGASQNSSASIGFTWEAQSA